MKMFSIPGTILRPIGYEAGVEANDDGTFQWAVQGNGFYQDGCAKTYYEAIEAINQAMKAHEKEQLQNL